MSDIYAVTVVLLSISFVVCCSPILSEMEKYSCEDVELTCAKPQPRVFFVSDFTEDEDLKLFWQINEVYPTSVVLHRCESSGCCEDSAHKCLPKRSKMEKVNLLFSYWTPDLKECKIIIEEFDHKECECRDPTKENKRKALLNDSCRF